MKRFLTALLTTAFLSSAQAHDIYTGLTSPAGQLCCGGTDCEAVTYFVYPDGAALFFSQRHQRQILLSPDQITWLPVPGGEASEAHWCGRKHISGDTDLDPDFHTFCAFIAPGGV